MQVGSGELLEQRVERERSCSKWISASVSVILLHIYKIYYLLQKKVLCEENKINEDWFKCEKQTSKDTNKNTFGGSWILACLCDAGVLGDQ